jgi:hypothetical protein
VWRYEYPTTSNIPDSQYNDAVQLRDGTVLLCGTLHLNPTEEGPRLVGLFTRIDGLGKVVSQTRTSPEPNSPSRLDYIDRCAATASGVIAVGHSRRLLHVPTRPDRLDFEDSYWLMGLDNAGAIRWQKYVLVPDTPPGQPSVTSGLRALIPLSGGDVVVVSLGAGVSSDRSARRPPLQEMLSCRRCFLRPAEQEGAALYRVGRQRSELCEA